jgi:tetratricopeptide (TPR) repeat protein
MFAYASSMAMNPTQVELFLQEGIKAFQTQEYLRAYLSLDRALEIQPENALLWGWRGLVLNNIWLILPLNEERRSQLPPKYADTWIAAQDSSAWKSALDRERTASFDRLQNAPPTTPELWQVRSEYSLWQGDCIHNDREGRTHVYLEALSSIEQAIALAPENAEIWNTHVKVLEKLSRFDEACQSAERALELAPTDYIAWNVYAYLLLWNLSRPQEALSAYDRALSLAPKQDSKQRLRAYRGRGIALEKLGRDEEALESYERSLQFGGNDSHSRAQRLRQKLTLASQERAIQANPQDWEAWYAKAKQFVAQESYTSAIPCYDRILELQPNLTEILKEHGTALAKVGRYAAAIADFDRLIELQPENHEIWYQKANALSQSQQYEAAIAIYDRLIALDPNHPALCDLGNALWELNRFEEAISAWDLALNHPFLAKERYQRQEIWYKRGLALINLERYEEAFFSHHHDSSYYSPKLENPDDDRIQLELQDAENWFSWGQYFECDHLDHSNFREMAILMQKAIALDPNLHSAMRLCAYAMLKLKRYAESVDYYERALAMDAAHAEDDHDFATDWHHLAIAQMKIERYESAIASCDRALAISPDNLHILTHRGDALRSAGRYDEAIATYDRVIAVKTPYQPVYFSKAVVYALQGDTEKVLENLRAGVNLKGYSNSFMNYAIASSQEPAFDSIREHPEFQALMQEVEVFYQKRSSIFPGISSGFYPDYPSG